MSTFVPAGDPFGTDDEVQFEAFEESMSAFRFMRTFVNPSPSVPTGHGKLSE